MHIVADHLDDILMKTLTRLTRVKAEVSPTKGANKEIFGALLELNKPRARLSASYSRGHIFSALGELFWYLAGSNELQFIQHYIRDYALSSDDGKIVHGAYGPRIFAMRGHDQLNAVIERLAEKPDTRRAVIQLFNAEDLDAEYKDIPCTTTFQFVVRKDHLHMMTHMRSNDAYLGLPHDIFCFTMLQEIVATELGYGLGKYKHSVGSLHLYDKHFVAANEYINEGWHQAVEMPPMPKASVMKLRPALLQIEQALRAGSFVDVSQQNLPEYWADILWLLQIYAASQSSGNGTKMSDAEFSQLKSRLSARVYDEYIDRRIDIRKRQPRAHQMQLPLSS